MIRYRAVLWDYPEDEPASAGLYSTLSYEQLPKTEWYESYEDALEAGKKLNARCGYDFFVRIEEDGSEKNTKMLEWVNNNLKLAFKGKLPKWMQFVVVIFTPVLVAPHYLMEKIARGADKKVSTAVEMISVMLIMSSNLLIFVSILNAAM